MKTFKEQPINVKSKTPLISYLPYEEQKEFLIFLIKQLEEDLSFLKLQIKETRYIIGLDKKIKNIKNFK